MREKLRMWTWLAGLTLVAATSRWCMAADEPLTEADVTALINLKIDDAAILARIEKGGLAFESTSEIVDRLKKAGASETVAKAVAAAGKKKGEPSGDVVTYQDVLKLVRMKIGDAAIADRLIKSPPGVFPLTNAQKHELKDAGASEALIVAMVEGGLTKNIDPAKDHIYLLEQSLKALRIVKTIDLRTRVYFKRTETDGKYQQFITGKTGKLGKPASFLLSGTTIRGDRMGGSKERFYVLTIKGKWNRSEFSHDVWYVQDDTTHGTQAIMTPNEDDDAPKRD
ncbi:MAG: hypothetical protein ACKVP0_11475 [Pirellulaceae bacterium]